MKTKKTKKPARKPAAKKKTKKPARNAKAPARKIKKSKPAAKTAKPKKIGKVTHFFNHLKVAVLKLGAPLSLGQKIQFQGATTDFSQVVSSMQIDHQPIKKAAKGKSIGLKVSKRVREGDQVLLA